MEITSDYKEEYDKLFGDFPEKKLPKDDLYYSIKDEIEAKTALANGQKKKDKKNPDAPLLPTVHADKM